MFSCARFTVLDQEKMCLGQPTEGPASKSEVTGWGPWGWRQLSCGGKCSAQRASGSCWCSQWASLPTLEWILPFWRLWSLFDLLLCRSPHTSDQVRLGPLMDIYRALRDSWLAPNMMLKIRNLVPLDQPILFLTASEALSCFQGTFTEEKWLSRV